MKALLIVSPSLGKARTYMIKIMLTKAGKKIQTEFVDNINDAELVIVLDKTIPKHCKLNGKKVYLGDINYVITNPYLFLNKAKNYATLYSKKIEENIKYIIAVTACPAGMIHSFMSAEIIKTEAKKRGWQIKVETHSLVSAKNIVTYEEIIQANLIIIATATDINIDLKRFSGKPIYQTSISLILTKTSQEFNHALVRSELY